MKVLITGASSGIGEALAKRCAFRSFDLVLVARRKEKLEELAGKLSKAHNVSVEVIDCDLTTKTGIGKVEKRLQKNDIDVLVNNAGMGGYGQFMDDETQDINSVIDLNVKAVVQLSHAAALSMKSKGMGSIVNISSIASYQPMPGHAIYGATKSFVTSFTHALREELRPHGINVMLVCPGLTKTEFFEHSDWEISMARDQYSEVLWQDPDEVADSILQGLDSRRGVVIPGLINKVMASVSSSLPSSVTRKISAYVAKGRDKR